MYAAQHSFYTDIVQNLQPVISATPEVEEGRSQVKSLSGLQGKFKASLGNLVRPNLKMWCTDIIHII